MSKTGRKRKEKPKYVPDPPPEKSGYTLCDREFVGKYIVKPKS